MPRGNDLAGHVPRAALRLPLLAPAGGPAVPCSATAPRQTALPNGPEPTKGGRTARRLGLGQLRIIGLRGGGGRAELPRLGEGLLQVRIVDVVDRRPKDRRRRNHVVPVPTAWRFSTRPLDASNPQSRAYSTSCSGSAGLNAGQTSCAAKISDLCAFLAPTHCLSARSASSCVRHIGFASHGSPLLANAVQSSCIFSDSTSSAGTVGPITASPITKAISPAW